MKIDTLHCALAGGFTIALVTFVLTIVGFLTGYGFDALNLLSFYPGYAVSPGGAAVGFLWGFIDGFIMFGFFAWIYNHLEGHHLPKKKR